MNFTLRQGFIPGGLSGGTNVSKTKYDYEDQINELLEDALHTLSEDDYADLLDSISMMIAEGM